MTIKHGSHTFDIDPVNTDTYRHYHDGHAERVAMASPDKFALIIRWETELTPEAIAERYMSDADIVICEGFKWSALPKIEIHRTATGEPPLLGTGLVDPETYCAVVTDGDSFTTEAPVIHLNHPDWLHSLADLVEQEIMKP